jgi:hypothetical protein
MSTEEPDFNIDNYNIEELLTIFGIESPIKKETIMKIAEGFIKKYRELEASKYVEFFSKGMNKLLSNYQLIEGILGKVDDFLDDIKDTKDKIEYTFEEGIQEASEQINKLKVTAQDFINPTVQDAGPNVLQNLYYNAQRPQTRVGTGVIMPNRADYTNVPKTGVGSHAPQLQNRLMLPNAFAQIPFAQGYRNPTLQNIFLTWINVDSQYRQILPMGSESSNCSAIRLAGITDTGATGPITMQDSSTDFTISLANPITNVLAMTVGSIEVPMGGYYTFSDKYGNTSFEFNPNEDKEEKYICLKVPEGNYDASGIMQVMNNILQKAQALCAGSTAGAPQLYINQSNQKTYFAKPFGSTGPYSFRWHGLNKCGCCSNCKNCTPSSEELKCSHKNTGKKLNSTFGWQMGFRTKTTTSILVDLTSNPVADGHFNEGITGSKSQLIVSSCTWNQLGTKYLILEVDDFNRNRYSGTMGTMSMPMSNENFKLPKYAKEISQVYPICDPSKNGVQRFPIPGSTNPKLPPERILHGSTDTGSVEDSKSYYEKFKRSCRKGTPANDIAIKGQDTLTHAQKYTAQEIRSTQKDSGINQYYAPQSSNMLFRFPVQRLSTNLQAAIITPGPGIESGRRYFGPVTIEKLRVRLLDDKGFPIDLNCSDISFSLITERLYQY